MTEPLSQREREVAVAVACGLSNRQIGQGLGITHRTVQTHIWRIMAKWGVRSRTGVAVLVLAGGLLPLEEAAERVLSDV